MAVRRRFGGSETTRRWSTEASDVQEPCELCELSGTRGRSRANSPGSGKVLVVSAAAAAGVVLSGSWRLFDSQPASISPSPHSPGPSEAQQSLNQPQPTQPTQRQPASPSVPSLGIGSRYSSAVLCRPVMPTADHRAGHSIRVLPMSDDGPPLAVV